MLFIVVIVFVGSVFVGVTGLLSDSPAYIDSMNRASTNKTLIEKIGEPIEQNGIMGGSVKYANGENSADLTIPIKGNKGKATIRVEGSGSDNNWTYTKMEVYISETDDIIDLLSTQKLQDTIQ